MNWLRYLFLFILGLGVVLMAAWFQTEPGYMDADYYLLGGMQLAEGKGFTEPILWNYLDGPIGIPHPSHAYWMPLTSILAAIGLLLTPFDEFTGGRLVFLILAGCIPPMTVWLARGLLTGRSERARQGMATLSGVLAAFSGFYLAFLTVPDAFAIYMLCGGLFLGLASSDWKGKWGILGIIAGVMHMTRADGFIWLGVALLVILFAETTGFKFRFKTIVVRGVWCVGGYLLIMGPWMARNLSVFGTLLAPGGGHALWVLNYDELFMYPPSILTFDRWWASGLGEIFQARLWALGQNLQTMVGVQGAVFLLPLVIMGLWKLQEKRAVQLGVLAWGLTLTAMTLVFPFSGARGGFFHSGAAVQPLFWAVVPVGLESFVEWGGRVRGWRVVQAQRVFGAGLVGLAIFLTGTIFVMRVSAQGEGVGYAEIEQKLVESGAKPGDVVMVNNPPGYYLASGRPAVVIPNGDEDTVLAVSRRYGIKYVVVDGNVPVGVRGLYEQPEEVEGLIYLEELEDFRIFEVEP